MGVATLDLEEPAAAAIIKRADERLYEAKSAGRNCVKG
jgi:PleD family two-component response regulator